MTFLKNQKVHQDQEVTLLKARLMKNESNINFIKRKSRQEEMLEGEDREGDMNDAVTLTGFVKESPHIKEMADGNAIAHFVVIVYDDDRNVSKEIPVLAMGKIATEAQFTLQRGVFISIYGTHGNFEKKTFTANGLKFPTIEVVAKTIEVLHTPDVKGMSVEDFIKIYSSEAITNRIKKITDKAAGKTPKKGTRK